jgi:hypothetical protein
MNRFIRSRKKPEPQPMSDPIAHNEKLRGLLADLDRARADVQSALAFNAMREWNDFDIDAEIQRELEGLG